VARPASIAVEEGGVLELLKNASKADGKPFLDHEALGVVSGILDGMPSGLPPGLANYGAANLSQDLNSRRDMIGALWQQLR